jgi:hypothetical protein
MQYEHSDNMIIGEAKPPTLCRALLLLLIMVTVTNTAFGQTPVLARVAAVEIQRHYMGLGAINLERETLNNWTAMDAVTRKPFDWDAIGQAYATFMDSAIDKYHEHYGLAVPTTDSELTHAVEFLQRYFFETKKFEYHLPVSLLSQTVVEHRADCDMMTLYLVDFLHALGVPLSELGILSIESVRWTQDHVILRCASRYYEPLPVLITSDSSIHYLNYSRQEAFKEYPIACLVPAEDTMETHNMPGILEVLSEMAIKYDPLDNGPVFDTGTYRPYPEQSEYIEQCNDILKVAIPFATRFVERNPRSVDVLGKLAVLDMIASRCAMLSNDTVQAYEEAIRGLDDFGECLYMAPTIASIHYNLALAYDGIVLHEPKLALEQAQAALDLEPDDRKMERERIQKRIAKLEREVKQASEK